MLLLSESGGFDALVPRSTRQGGACSGCGGGAGGREGEADGTAGSNGVITDPRVGPDEVWKNGHEGENRIYLPLVLRDAP